MGDITGDSIYEKFGNEFPLLIKFIEARQKIFLYRFIRVMKWQKRDIMLTEKLKCGISLRAEKGSKIYTGFKEGVTKEIYEQAVLDGNSCRSCLMLKILNPAIPSLPLQEEFMRLEQE